MLYFTVSTRKSPSTHLSCGIGYIIQRATKKNGKYKQIKVIKSWKKTSFTDKKVKSKKTYFYKIRPYKGKVKGPVSAAKKVKVK